MPNVNGRPNSDVMKPWINGGDITDRPANRWISGHHPSTRLLIPLYLQELEKAAERARNSPDNPNRNAKNMSDDELVSYMIDELRKLRQPPRWPICWQLTRKL